MRAPSKLAVIGDPIDHSLSPAMQNAALRAAGLDMVYEAHRVPASSLPTTALELRASVSGFNVTSPHKVAIIPYVDRLDETAVHVGAVNTVVREEGGLFAGYNTDAEGFRRAVVREGLEMAGAQAVVFGAGGAARAVIWALVEEGARVAVIGRTQLSSQNLASLFGCLALASDDSRIGDLLASADLVVNATPLGLGSFGEISPLDSEAKVSPSACLVDLVYGRVTPFEQVGFSHGLRVVDGLEMLVQQGAASFRLFTRVEPDVEVMRAACERELQARKSLEPVGS